MASLTCFKAYDIRGQLGNELNEEITYRIGRAYANFLDVKRVVIDGDMRLSPEELNQALANGLIDAGCAVIYLCMTGTEEVYFAAFHLNVDGGIEVTASHNPIDFNGMKLVRRGARPISGDTGLKDIQRLAETGDFAPVGRHGTLVRQSCRDAYIEHLLSYISPVDLRPLKLVVTVGNVIDALEQRVQALGAKVEFITIHHEADGTFPNGIPNPILPKNRAAAADAVKAHGADMGIAWDGDFDRCFLFDERGEFIEGYYIVGLLAEGFLKKEPGAKIIHDPRLTWNTIDICAQYAGQAIQSKTGRAFIKERMRKENTIYGGAMSTHHYFRDFAYCDSGIIPWLLVAALMSRQGKKLSLLIGLRMAAYPWSGEINYTISDAKAILAAVQVHFAEDIPKVDTTDGLSLEFDDWRMNIRASSAEPLLRLNIEIFREEDILGKNSTQFSD